MKKPIYILILSVIFLVPLCLFAQEEDLEELKVGIETAGKLLADIPITHFEDADTWNSVMSIDQGIIISMRRRGRPLEIAAIDPNDGTENENVFGARVAFTQRGYSTFRMSPPRPIKVPGITKALSVWVCGRSFQHRLYAHVLDYEGNEMMLDMGMLDFVGWRKVSRPIPSSIISMDSMALPRSRYSEQHFGSLRRSKENLTSSAVSGLPLENLTPFLR